MFVVVLKVENFLQVFIILPCDILNISYQVLILQVHPPKLTIIVSLILEQRAATIWRWLWLLRVQRFLLLLLLLLKKNHFRRRSTKWTSCRWRV